MSITKKQNAVSRRVWLVIRPWVYGIGGINVVYIIGSAWFIFFQLPSRAAEQAEFSPALQAVIVEQARQYGAFQAQISAEIKAAKTNVQATKRAIQDYQDEAESLRSAIRELARGANVPERLEAVIAFLRSKEGSEFADLVTLVRKNSEQLSRTDGDVRHIADQLSYVSEKTKDLIRTLDSRERFGSKDSLHAREVQESQQKADAFREHRDLIQNRPSIVLAGYTE